MSITSAAGNTNFPGKIPNFDGISPSRSPNHNALGKAKDCLLCASSERCPLIGAISSLKNFFCTLASYFKSCLDFIVSLVQNHQNTEFLDSKTVRNTCIEALEISDGFFKDVTRFRVDITTDKYRRCCFVPTESVTRIRLFVNGKEEVLESVASRIANKSYVSVQITSDDPKAQTASFIDVYKEKLPDGKWETVAIPWIGTPLKGSPL